MKWRVSGLGEVGVAGAKSGCGCPVRVTFLDGRPCVGAVLKAQVLNVTGIRMFVAALSNLVLENNPVVLEPGASCSAIVRFPWILWLIPGNLTRISAKQVQELEAVGYDKKQQERQAAFLREELYTKYPEFKPKRSLSEKVKKHREVPLTAGRRRILMN